MYRFAIVTSHPIQYQAAWFRALAQVTDLVVHFCHRQDAAGQAEAGFGVAFDWDVPLVDGYQSRWLANRARRPDVSRLFGCDTPEIGGVIRDGRFDACLVCGWYLKSYLQTIVACRRTGTPVFVRGDSQLATPRPRLLAAAKHFPYRWLLSSVDGHLYVGRANREYLQHYGVTGDRLFFAPHFVDNAFFAALAAEARGSGRAAAIRAACGADEAATLCVFVGKLIEKKRPDDFVRALASARSRGADVRGLVVGSGPLGPAVERLAQDLAVPVTFASFQNQTQLPAHLAAADVIVLPSDGRETWGLVVNEAMACGLPAIVSRSAGCSSDLVEEGVTGFTFEVGDTEALAARMGALVERRRRDRDCFRPAVLERIGRYDVGAAVKGTLQAIESVAASPSTSESRAVKRDPKPVPSGRS